MNTVKNSTTIRLQLHKDRLVRSCNTINELSNKACVPNKTRFKSKHVQLDYKNK